MGVIGKVKFAYEEHKPAVCFALGVIGFIGTCVSVYRARPAFEEVLEKHRNDISERKQAIEIADAPGSLRIYDKKERRNDLLGIWLRTIGGTIKAFWKSGILGGLSIWSFGKGFKILKDQIVGLSAAYSALATSWSGETENAVSAALDEEIVCEAGACDALDDEMFANGYCLIFRKGNPNYVDDMESNRFFLDRKERWFNDRLVANEHVWLNYVVDELGFDSVDCGQVLGWRHYKDPAKAFENGSDNYIALNPTLIITEDGQTAYLLRLNIDRKPLLGRTGLKNQHEEATV